MILLPADLFTSITDREGVIEMISDAKENLEDFKIYWRMVVIVVIQIQTTTHIMW
jgi:hypothetical protein